MGEDPHAHTEDRACRRRSHPYYVQNSLLHDLWGGEPSFVLRRRNRAEAVSCASLSLWAFIFVNTWVSCCLLEMLRTPLQCRSNVVSTRGVPHHVAGRRRTKQHRLRGHHAGARGPAAPLRWQVQRRNFGAALHHSGDREEPCPPHPCQAPGRLAGARCRHRTSRGNHRLRVSAHGCPSPGAPRNRKRRLG